MRLTVILGCLIISIGSSIQAATYVVTPDGTGDFPTIQAAVEGCQSGDVIELTDGTFVGTGNYNVDLMGLQLTIHSQSGIADDCIIDCQQAGRGFILQSGEPDGTSIQDLTLRNGLAAGQHEAGGGILCANGANVLLHGVTIDSCVCDEGGGALKCDVGCKATIRYCSFRYNGSTSNTSFGGALDFLVSYGWIIQSDFIGNASNAYGGAVHICISQVQFIDCLFEGNRCTGQGGALMFEGSPAEGPMIGCTFSNNRASGKGGGICLYNGQTEITECTFYANSAGFAGAGIALDWYGELAIDNCIVAFSTQGEAIWDLWGDPLVLSCCDLYGNAGGDWVGFIEDQYGARGNIAIDPLFCDAENSDFTLHSNSPCAPFTQPNPECDLIGAWPVGCGPSGIEEALPADGIFLSRALPNPLTESTCFTFRIPVGVLDARLHIHDASGRLVRTWSRDPGMQTVTWDGRDGVGRLVPAGVYYIHLNAGKESAMRTITVIR